MSGLRRSKRVSANISFSKSKKYEPTEIPEHGDDILVHWELDDTFIWWKAIVTSSFYQNNPPVIGKGTVTYEPYGKYDEETSDVEFIFQLDGGKMIRCIGSECPNSWVFSDEYIEPPQSSPCEISTESITPGRCTLEEKISHYDINSTDGKPNELKDDSTPYMGENKNIPSTSLEPLHTVQVQHNGTINDNGKGPPLVPLIFGSESRDQKSGFCIDQFHGFFYKEVSKTVIHELRWNLLKKLQTNSNNKYPPTTCYPKQHEISVGTSCTLQSFIAIANTINNELVKKRQKPYSEQVKFLPSLRTLISGSMSSVSFDILLTSFADLSFILGLKEDDDYENLVCRESTLSSKHSTSIIGTIHKDEHNGNKLERIIIGHAGSSENISEIEETVSDTDFTPCVILQHELDDDAWDETQECFVTPWVSYQSRILPCFPFDQSNYRKSKKIFFKISWLRNTAPSKRRWTNDAIHVGSDVLGTSTLTVPIVLIEGQRTVDEIKHHMDIRIEKIMQQREQRFSTNS